jgi:signal transduction histidine kinase
VEVREEAAGLVFVVTDDGAGFDVRGADMGAGFTNMHDRLGALGGTLRVESAPGRGTRVTGVVPLPQRTEG